MGDRRRFHCSAVEHCRVGDRDGPADAGDDVAGTRRIGAGQIDAGHDGPAARNRQRAAAGGGRVAEADRVGGGGDRDEIDELLVVTV